MRQSESPQSEDKEDEPHYGFLAMLPIFKVILGLVELQNT